MTESPSPNGPHAIPPSSPIGSKLRLVHEFKFEGKKYRLFKRKPGVDAPWYFQIQRAGVRRPRCLETNIAENAILKAKASITAAKGEHWQAFLDKTTLRQTCAVTLGKILEHYRAYPNRKPAASTRELNIHAILDLCGHLKEDVAAELPLTHLTADLVWHWKQRFLENAAGGDSTPHSALRTPHSDQRHRQLLRSANSRLVQARSLFTADLLSYYKRQGKLVLPKTLDDFLKEPKFPADETGKTDYWPPGDNIIAKTFTSLADLNSHSALRTSNSALDDNLFLAIWLALGFGLRKSEITQAKVNWFQNIGGILYCAGDELAKNDRFPRVRCQLGAWEKISPHLAGREPDDFILTGNQHERSEAVFRRCSHWMRGLGWSTQKTVHEFRSYAGCQVAMGDRTGPIDLRAAQEFLRHASITTTENFYMRYLRSQLKEVTLQLPTPQPFIPKIVGG